MIRVKLSGPLWKLGFKKIFLSKSDKSLDSYRGKTFCGRDERCKALPCSVDNTCKR